MTAAALTAGGQRELHLIAWSARNLIAAAVALASLMVAAPNVALAHGVRAPEQARLTAWPVGIDAIVGLLAATGLYTRGVKGWGLATVPLAVGAAMVVLALWMSTPHALPQR